MRPKQLFSVRPDLVGLPYGKFMYASRGFASRNLPEHLLEIVEKMAEQIPAPRVSYQFKLLQTGEKFGHGRMHCDGRQTEDELHRLLTVGGVPTLGEDGTVLSEGTVWEYSGRYRHQARPVAEDTFRLLLRVSKTQMPFRDHWIFS